MTHLPIITLVFASGHDVHPVRLGTGRTGLVQNKISVGLHPRCPPVCVGGSVGILIEPRRGLPPAIEPPRNQRNRISDHFELPKHRVLHQTSTPQVFRKRPPPLRLAIVRAPAPGGLLESVENVVQMLNNLRARKDVPAEYVDRDLREGGTCVVDHCGASAREAVVEGEGHVGKPCDWLSFMMDNPIPDAGGASFTEEEGHVDVVRGTGAGQDTSYAFL